MLQSHSWRQSGAISLWRYVDKLRPCNYAGWHLTANEDGRASLVSLLDAFESDNTDNSRTLTVVPPTSAILVIPNNWSSAWIAPEKLRLSFSTNPSQWYFPESAGTAEFTFGSNWLTKLRQGITDISRGEGDYSIGVSEGGNLKLWFWWQPAQITPR